MPKILDDQAFSYNGKRIKDLTGDLGRGRVIDIYTNCDSGVPEDVLICEFGRGADAIHADRSLNEVELI